MAKANPSPASIPAKVRHLVIVLGDQLDEQSAALKDFDASQDVVWMAEVAEESTHVWSAKQRIAVFLSAMRHFAEHLRTQKIPVHYTRLDDAGNLGSLPLELGKAIAQLQPAALILAAPGDWRVLQSLRAVATQHQLALDLRDVKTSPLVTLKASLRAASASPDHAMARASRSTSTACDTLGEPPG